MQKRASVIGASSNAMALLNREMKDCAWGNKCFRTRDKQWLAFSCLDPDEQRKAFTALGVVKAALLTDEEALEDHIADYTIAELEAKLQAKGIDWVVRVKYMEDSMDCEAFLEQSVPLRGVTDGGGKRTLRQPVTFDCARHEPEARAPPLGYHQALLSDVAVPDKPSHEPELRNGAGRPVTKFSEVRVVELGDLVGCAAGGRLLADLGYEVIKVEPAAGDPLRTSQPTLWEHLSKGKKSVAMNLGAGDELRQLLKQADVFLTSRSKPELERLGCDYAKVSKDFPGLVFVHVSARGYGKPGWNGLGAEFLYFYAGADSANLLDWIRPLSRIPFEDDDEPTPQLPLYFGEHATSLHVPMAVAGALIHKRQTGQAQKVEVTLTNASLWVCGAFYSVFNYIEDTNGLKIREPGSGPCAVLPDRFPYKFTGVDKNPLRFEGGSFIPGLQPYQCKDGYVQLLEIQPVPPLKRIIGALDPAAPGWTLASAIGNAVFMRGIKIDRISIFLKTHRDKIRELMAKLTTGEVEAKFGNPLDNHAKVRYITVRPTTQLLSHEQVIHLKLVTNGGVRSPIVVPTFAPWPTGPEASGPKLGEHNGLLAAAR